LCPKKPFSTISYGIRYLNKRRHKIKITLHHYSGGSKTQ
jgi:hypothetical protein